MALDKDGVTLLIDPGNLTAEFAIPTTVRAIVVTHQHADHLDSQKISDILAVNPHCEVFALSSVLAQLQGNLPARKLRTVAPGDTVDVAGFHVAFVGGRHAVIHKTLTRIDNVGVMVDRGVFFYPGDALDVPATPVTNLALPASAPWMKIGETIDYLLAVQPQLAFPVHDAILSDSGQQIVDTMLRQIANAHDITYQRFKLDTSHQLK